MLIFGPIGPKGAVMSAWLKLSVVFVSSMVGGFLSGYAIDKMTKRKGKKAKA